MPGIDKEVYTHGSKLLGDTVPRSVFDEMVQLRRKLHASPELAFEEHKTAALIREELCRIEGCEVLETPCAGTGVLAVLHGEAATTR